MYGTNKKGHILVNLGEFEDDPPPSLSSMHTAWKMYKYRVFSGPNTAKYGPEKTRIWALFTNLELLDCENAQKYAKKGTT